MEKSAKYVEVVPATTKRWDLLCDLFTGCPGIDGCWCMWPLREPLTHRPDPNGNRKAMKALVNAGEIPGLLALIGERAVGWYAVGPRDRYPQYKREHDQAHAWAIPCIYVDPAADRSLVGRALITAALELAEGSGAASLDGPPPWWSPGDPDAATKMFQDNGFKLIGTGARMAELRRVLHGPAGYDASP